MTYKNYLFLALVWETATFRTDFKDFHSLYKKKYRSICEKSEDSVQSDISDDDDDDDNHDNIHTLADAACCKSVPKKSN